jgi:hypothetical protein
MPDKGGLNEKFKMRNGVGANVGKRGVGFKSSGIHASGDAGSISYSSKKTRTIEGLHRQPINKLGSTGTLDFYGLGIMIKRGA